MKTIPIRCLRRPIVDHVPVPAPDLEEMSRAQFLNFEHLPEMLRFNDLLSRLLPSRGDSSRLSALELTGSAILDLKLSGGAEATFDVGDVARQLGFERFESLTPVSLLDLGRSVEAIALGPDGGNLVGSLGRDPP